MALTAFMPIPHIGEIGHMVLLDSNAVKVAIISIIWYEFYDYPMTTWLFLLCKWIL